MRRALLDGVDLQLVYEDDSRFGTVISGELERRLKQHFAPLADMLEGHAREAVAQAPALIEHGLRSGGFHDAAGRVDAGLMRPDVRSARPAALRIQLVGQRARQVALPERLLPDLAARLGEWQRDAQEPPRGPARALWAALSEAGAFGAMRPASKVRGPVTFVGHATVLLECGGARILVDPFLLPREDRFPPGYQPLTHGDITADAILITHSHPDHFHLGSLLRLGCDTPVFVPAVPEESALSIDMAHRLREIGMRRVQPMGWHDAARVANCRILALPFHGEQPTAEKVLHPEVRNQGNVWLVEGDCEGASRRFAFVADAGRDHAGDVRAVASDSFEREGPIDVLFGGFRAWSLYPIQYITSSVPQHLLFVPRSLWGSRQQIMNDADALLDTAERWHAGCVVPYAAGGAPWYWQLGLGARGDGPVHGSDDYFDPRPEAVLSAATRRSAVAGAVVPSPVHVQLMRPGDSLSFRSDGHAVAAQRVQNPGHAWPYIDPDAASETMASVEEPLGLSRKRVLLRLLADAELARRGETIETGLIQQMSEDLRHQHGLTDPDDMLSWLQDAGLGMSEYCEILAEWQAVLRLEDLLADPIERRLAGQRAFATMRLDRRR